MSIKWRYKMKKIFSEDISGVNQIIPHKNKWAWDMYLKACNNNWMPTEISMAKDIEQWNSDLFTDEERLVIRRCLGFFAGAESLVGNNLFFICRHVNDAEIRNYIARQIFEESLHNLTLVYVCEI
ncbi:MAG: ribonucleotide-diphosphate reductase subunit beta, partial [Bacteroidales bacterium]